jgi:Rieske 2Fe-2S family protein
VFNQTTHPAAPIDPEDLALALKPFGSSRMLPKAAYVEAEVLAWEREHIFSSWVCIGRSSEVPERRSMKSFDLGRSSVLVARGDDGVLRAFENACRHRGHELLPCSGVAESRAIVCPYHAWTYELDGSLRGAPGFKNHGDFDRSELGLFTMPVEDWHGWLFVDPSGKAGSLANHVGELEGIVDRYDAETLQTPVTHTYDVAANWKVIVENYQECYHCSMIHPELCKVSPPTSGENISSKGNWVGGWMDLREGAVTMSLDGQSSGAMMARLDDTEQHTVMYVAMLPNLLISLHPDYVMSHLLTPISPNRTRITCSWAFPPHAMESDSFDPSYAVDFWDLTNRQDWSACESVQRGIQSPRYVPGPLAPAEDGVYQFVSLIAGMYSGEVTN